jgi:acetyl esterase/lipase
MDIAIPASPSASNALPMIVCIHGGGWSAGSRADMEYSFPWFAQHGYASCSIDYRLAPGAAFPANLQDCNCAVRFVRAHATALHIDPNHIGVFGASAGAHLALMVALAPQSHDFEGDGGWSKESSAAQCVVEWAGPSDLVKHSDTQVIPQSGLALVEGLLGGSYDTHEALAAAASPITYVHSGEPPILIMQGDQDNIVPMAQSVEIYQALQAHGDDAQLKILHGAGHITSEFASADSQALVLSFLDRVLKPGLAK